MKSKRHFGEEECHDNDSQTKYQKVVKYVMEEAFLQEIAEKIATRLKPAFRKVVKEELEQYIGSTSQSSPGRSVGNQSESFPSRKLQLVFIKQSPPTLFTNTKIEDEDNSPLQVQLIDANSGTVIQHGKLSSMKVEIVALSGEFLSNGHENWSETEFNDNIVRQREGKRPLLIGDRSIVLVNGVASLANVSFTDNSSWIRSGKFKLGVRAVGSVSVGIGVKEAVSKAFKVKDHRGESYQKHPKPLLDDPVWRLKQISRTGVTYKKLEAHEINTVKDFLMHYNTNPSNLRQLLGVPNKAWDAIVRHANECHLDNTRYRYYSAESEIVELLFNCVYKVIAVKFSGQDYRNLDSLDSYQKAVVEKLKQCALVNPDELVPVDNSSATHPFELQTIGYNTPFGSTHLDFHRHESFSVIDQDTSSYPNIADEGGYLPEDSTSPTNQTVPIHEPTQFTFMTQNPASIPSEGWYNCYVNSPDTTYAHNFEEVSVSHPQTAPWGLDNDLYTSFTPNSHGIPFQRSGNGSPKAGWCKLRAAVMWYIVRRNAAARRKAKFHYNMF